MSDLSTGNNENRDNNDTITVSLFDLIALIETNCGINILSYDVINDRIDNMS